MENKDNQLQLFQYLVEGVFLVIFGTIGCVGNIICIITFSKKFVQKSFHHLMLSLAIFDLLYILMSIMLFGLPTLIPSMRMFPVYAYLVPVLLPLAQIGLTGSIYLTVAISIERYTTVVHPFFRHQHSWSSSIYIIPVVIFSILFNVTKFFELTTEVQVFPSSNTTSSNINSSITEIEFTAVIATSLRQNSFYVQVYIVYMNLLFNGLIPLIILVSLNLLVYNRLREFSNCVDTILRGQSVQRRELLLARISCLIVAVFILSHSIRWIPNIYELQQGATTKADLVWPLWVQYTVQFSHLLTTINSSVNYYIYTLKHYTGHIPRDLLPRHWASQGGQGEVFGSQNGETVMTRIDSKKTSLIVWTGGDDKNRGML